MAWLHVLIVTLVLTSSCLLASQFAHPLAYLGSQCLLALGLTQAFSLLHEAGHRSLFRQRWLNDVVGHVAGFMALIPYATWRPIHARHHRYVGWQDLDATTQTLTPRLLAPWERILINAAWRSGLPLFSVMYRLQNYWHIRRIRPLLGRGVSVVRLKVWSVAYLLAYGLVVAGFGIYNSLVYLGPGLLLALAFQDLLLLSQHTHMPTCLSGGQTVRPFAASQQLPFTRSLRLPAWLSWLLLHIDAHELHHLYPAVPGYWLRRIPYTPPHEINWLVWLRQAKSMSGTQFLFEGPRLEQPP